MLSENQPPCTEESAKIYIQYSVAKAAKHDVLVCNYYLTVFCSFLPAKWIGVI